MARIAKVPFGAYIFLGRTFSMVFNLAVQATEELVGKSDVSFAEKSRQIAALRQQATTAEQKGRVRALEQVFKAQYN